jgi:hypothetical protein
MASTHDVKKTIDTFEGIIFSIEMAYPFSYFTTPDKELEGYIHGFKQAREDTDFEKIRDNAKSIYEFLEERIPAGTRRDFYLSSLEATCKRIFELVPPVNLS